MHRKFQHAAVGQRAEECTGDMDQADTAGATMKSVGCEWTDDGKYQPRGKERGWYEDQGEEYLFIKAPAVSCGESERKREKNSVNRSDCDH